MRLDRKAGDSRMTRTIRARLAGLGAAMAVVLMCVSPAGATAAVELDVKAQWGPTTLVPGEAAGFVLHPRNLGSTDSSGTITIVDELPQGVVATEVVAENEQWECSGTTAVTCERSSSIQAPNKTFRKGFGPRVFIEATVQPGAGPLGTNTATISGGETVSPASEVDSISIANETTPFGIVPQSFEADLFQGRWPAPSRERQAGSHPYEFRVNFDLTLDKRTSSGGDPFTAPTERVRTAEVILPRGISGNPENIPMCDPLDFLSAGANFLLNTHCPPETQVGLLDIDINEGQHNYGYGATGPGILARAAVYNVEPPKGVPFDFAARLGPIIAHIYPSLDAEHNYAIKATAPGISSTVGVRSVRFTMWGVPADPAHDLHRAYASQQPGGVQYGAPTTTPIRPLLTLPMDCGIDNGRATLSVDSWTSPGAFTPPVDSIDPPLSVTGCDDQRIRFEPDVSLQPTNRDAGGPTGLKVDLLLPQRDQTVDNATKLYAQNGNVHGVDTPPMKKVVVTMPEGMTLSTSAAQGLTSCSPAEISLGTNDPVTCPLSSQYGTLTLHTPILPPDQPMAGRIFIAKQNDNPFKDFLAMYLVVQEPDRGLLVKIPGKIELDPVTGQIKTTFDDLPQFPVSDMELNFKGGVRAALVNPSTCGTKAIAAEFFSWHNPNTPFVVSSAYDITQKTDGSPCVNSLGDRPFRPEMSAGTISPSAGSYSPFVFRLSRTDDDQEFSQLGVTMPPGLLAKISGIAECSEAGIKQAEAPARTGLEEQFAPSCPASSQVGTTNVGTGVGVPLTYVPGKAYLAGPYKGSPLSLVVISPALAGPYDLGVIAVRSAIDINASTAQVTISTDPFPQIFKGIPVRIRDIRVNADRPETMINPTSCDPMEITAHVTGTGGDVNTTADDTAADLSSRFQAANCASLGFKPHLGFRLRGGTSRGDFPALRATLRARPGDANIARTQVTLPRSTFIEQGHIRTVCTRVQFAADQCPAGSIYGKARAVSPLFDEALEGPVYLRSNGGERLLPDLVVSLDGKIDVVLAGFIDSTNERVRNTFDVIPDAPVTKFTLQMQGGKKGLLVNSRDLCSAPSRAEVRMTGQNGKTYRTHPTVGIACKKRKSSK